MRLFSVLLQLIFYVADITQNARVFMNHWKIPYKSLGVT